SLRQLKPLYQSRAALNQYAPSAYHPRTHSKEHGARSGEEDTPLRAPGSRLPAPCSLLHAPCRLAMRPFEATKKYFQRAADQLGLADSLRTFLITPRRELQVQVPVEMDNGQLRSLIGYRVQHNRARGPMKGGLRYHPEVDLDEVRSLA